MALILSDGPHQLLRIPLVWFVAFSPDGHTLASSSNNGTIKLWNTATGQLQRILQGFQSRANTVFSAVFSPRGDIIASCDNDRTIINLIWHENISNVLNEIKVKKCQKGTNEQILLYKRILDNICIGDLMDRVIFQNQIWHLGEYSSLLKTFYNNWIIHSFIDKANDDISYTYSKIQKKPIEFTKVLTKYSTEYNNNIFITQLCEKLFFDKKDLFWFFTNIVKNVGIQFCLMEW